MTKVITDCDSPGQGLQDQLVPQMFGDCVDVIKPAQERFFQSSEGLECVNPDPRMETEAQQHTKAMCLVPVIQAVPGKELQSPMGKPIKKTSTANQDTRAYGQLQKELPCHLTTYSYSYGRLASVQLKIEKMGKISVTFGVRIYVCVCVCAYTYNILYM